MKIERSKITIQQRGRSNKSLLLEEGNESLLSGEMISPRTYYRWVTKIDKAGLGNLLSDIKLKQAISDYIGNQFCNLPFSESKSKVIAAVSNVLDNIQISESSD